jgi:predicted RNA-binding Zn-ribbon protein involved in translation (DUF1610 family)
MKLKWSYDLPSGVSKVRRNTLGSFRRIELEEKPKLQMPCPRCGRQDIYVEQRYNGKSRIDGETIVCANCWIDEKDQSAASAHWIDELAYAVALENRDQKIARAVAQRLQSDE